MARQTLGCTAARTTIGAEGFGSAAMVDQNAFETALGVLVTDAASPTQAHVTTANTAYSAFNKDVFLSVDTSKVTSISSLRAAVENLIRGFIAAGMAP